MRQFYAVNEVDTFQYDRPYHSGGHPDKHNEFRTMCIERSRYRTTSQFPGILRWFEVSACSVTHLSPVEFTCETVAAKNGELRQLIARYSNNNSQAQASNLNPLTMRLQGSIEAAVSGGMTKYKEAFFNGNTVSGGGGKLSSSAAVALESLATHIGEQAKLLQEGLDLHGQLAPEPLKPLHSRLVEVFSHLRTEMMQCTSFTTSSPISHRFSRIVNTPLPPIPAVPAIPVVPDPDKSIHSASTGSLYGRMLPGSDSPDPEEVYSLLGNYHDIVPFYSDHGDEQSVDMSLKSDQSGEDLPSLNSVDIRDLMAVNRRYRTAYENSDDGSIVSSSVHLATTPLTHALNQDRTPPLPPRNSFRKSLPDEVSISSSSQTSLNFLPAPPVIPYGVSPTLPPSSSSPIRHPTPPP